MPTKKRLQQDNQNGTFWNVWKCWMWNRNSLVLFAQDVRAQKRAVRQRSDRGFLDSQNAHSSRCVRAVFFCIHRIGVSSRKEARISDRSQISWCAGCTGLMESERRNGMTSLFCSFLMKTYHWRVESFQDLELQGKKALSEIWTLLHVTTCYATYCTTCYTTYYTACYTTCYSY